MQRYKRLTPDKRYQIAGLLKAGCKFSGIAIEVGVDKSTISREIQRNKGPGKYNPEKGQQKAEFRKRNFHKHSKLTVEMEEIIKEKLEEKWSPEQIYGHCKRKGIDMISHESIYKYIRKDRKNRGSLYKDLRHSKKKRKKYGSKEKRGQIKNRVSIEKRPKIVDQKVRIGDWEGDLIIGKDHKGAIITLVERVSKVTLARKIAGKNSDDVADKIINMLSPFAPISHTLTFDNGKEFANHDKIAKALGIEIYFAHPYSSWERGLNENTNGLIRQYWPKKTNFENISKKAMRRVIYELNLRPRKMLGFASPAEAFAERSSRW